MIHFFLAISLFYIPLRAFSYECDFETDSTSPIVYLNVAIKGGSSTDPDGKSGLTSFLGQMLLRGTEHQSQEEIDQAVDEMGATLDVDIRTESLIIRGAFLKKEAEAYLSLFKEILTQPRFTQKEISRQKLLQKALLEEEKENDAVLASRFFKRFLFPNHPYGKSTIGSTKSLTSFTKEDLELHYKDLMQNSRILVVGSGDYPAGKMRAWSKEIADLKPDLSANQTLPSLKPPLDAPKSKWILVDKPGRTQTQINLGQVGVKMDDPKFYPLFLGNEAFGSLSFLSTLMDEIRTKRGLSYGASSFFGFGTQARSWQINVFPAVKDAGKTLKLTLDLLSELKTTGLSQEKFNFAQESFLNKAGFMYNTPEKRVENRLVEKTLNLPKHTIRSYADRVKNLTLSEVNQALKDFLKPNQIVTVVLGSGKDLRHSIAEAADISTKSIEIIPYTAEE